MSDVSEEPLASLANNILHLTSDIWHLVASERDHWVYLRRPPRRNPTGYERHEDQQQCNDSNGQGISHADSKKLFSHSRLPRPAPERLAVQQTLQAITNCCAHCQSQQDQFHSLPNHQPQDVGGLRAERHTNADLVRALGDRIGQHAGESDGGEQERQAAEETQEPRGQAFLSKRGLRERGLRDRKSTRLNSSHVKISYAVFCLKK